MASAGAALTRRVYLLLTMGLFEPDGSYLTRIGGLRLRVIDAEVTVTGADGSRVHGVYRLATTLTDHRTDPVSALCASTTNVGRSNQRSTGCATPC